MLRGTKTKYYASKPSEYKIGNKEDNEAAIRNLRNNQEAVKEFTPEERVKLDELMSAVAEFNSKYLDGQRFAIMPRIRDHKIQALNTLITWFEKIDHLEVTAVRDNVLGWSVYVNRRMITLRLRRKDPENQPEPIAPDLTITLTDMLQEDNPSIAMDSDLHPPASVSLLLSETAPTLPIPAPSLETSPDLSEPDPETGEVFNLKFK
jgi:hypothetical protein